MAMKAQFHADRVAVSRECFTPDFSVLGIHFAEGDPEVGGEHWSFSCASGDDEGVCVVKEIQQAVFYNGIAEPSLSRGPLDSAYSIDDMDIPGYRLHRLTGDRQGIWTITVNANWRLTFRFEEGNAYLLNYEDYH
ncbi:MAG: hypothetical protein DHS20C11_06390 [Lysobacteraceae bacterium]|nr:MAG: hypothetical protein DHS20C11_06390 [Xanthomonadaceae bacterium]